MSDLIPMKAFLSFLIGLIIGGGSFAYWFIEYYNDRDRVSLVGIGMGLLVMILAYLIGVDIIG